MMDNQRALIFYKACSNISSDKLVKESTSTIYDLILENFLKQLEDYCVKTPMSVVEGIDALRKDNKKNINKLLEANNAVHSDS